jgi:hypothetical protein
MEPAIAAIWLQLTADERIPSYLDLSQDLAFALLPPGAAASYIDAALRIGHEAAAVQTHDPFALARDLGVTVTHAQQDLRVGAAAIRAEYDARLKTVTLYSPAVAAVDRCLAEAITAPQTAAALLLAHELFHHLEATRFPPVDQQLPPIERQLLGGLWRQRRHLRACREIAAHAFASHLLDLPFYAGALEWLLAMTEGRLTPAEVAAALNDANLHLNPQT